MAKFILQPILVLTLPLNWVFQFLGVVSYSFYFGFICGWRGAKSWLY